MSTAVLIAVWAAHQLDKTPTADNVKAGWTAFAVFIALGVAVVLLGISLSRHLRKAREGAEHGVFGDEQQPSSSHHPSTT
jgi:hypothetical protein